ncbi:CHAT domain-containing protein [Aspergillus tetrazonus]
MPDLDRVIQLGWEAVHATPEGHPDRAKHLNYLGSQLSMKYSRTKEMPVLDQAIQLGWETVNATPEDHPDHAKYLNNLGKRLSKKYASTKEMVDLNEAIDVGWKVANATPGDHPDLAKCLSRLGNQLESKYSRTNEQSDLDKAIQLGWKAVKVTPEDHPDRIEYLDSIGNRLGDRYSRTGAMTDLEEAIKALQEAVDATPEHHPDCARYLHDLGIQLVSKYSRTGAIADHEKAIKVIQDAVDATPEDHPDRAASLNGLALAHGDMYLRTGAIADLDKAIQVSKDVVKATPEDDPERALYLANLGNRLDDRYSRFGATADLEEAIRLMQEAVAATPGNHPDKAMFSNNLAIMLGNRYSRTGATADLDDAIQVSKKVVDATPDDHPDKPLYLNILAVVLGDRYSRTGETADLDEAIEAIRKAIAATPEDHIDRAIYLNTLGKQLGNRYSRTGATVYIEEAIQVIQEAIDATTEDHLDRAMYLDNLGIRLADRYSRTGAVADLDQAIQVGREAVNARQRDHPSRALYLNNLGARLDDRYSITGATADLEEAIQVMQEAVDATPEDHPNHAMYLNNLGSEFGDRYSITGDIADLNKAIELLQKAVIAVPDDHPDRAVYSINLANQFGDRYSRTKFRADFNAAIAYYESALHQPTALASSRIQAGNNVLQYCAATLDWQHGYEAAHMAVNLIPRLTPRSLETSDKQHMLAEVAGLASDAAAAALNAHKGALTALKLLEQGRGLLAASLEEVRVSILGLQQKYPALAGQFVHLRNILEKPVTRNKSADHESSWQAQARQRYDAEKKFDKLIIEIREKPGFDDFLQAPSEEQIRLTGQNGPIIIINVSRHRCDAIINLQNRIFSLPLPKLKRHDIEENARKDNLGSSRVLEWLWDTVMDPILEALEFTESPPDNNWPHVWWIPTGPLSKFPLHAAGYHHEGTSRTVLDRAMSSYSSSVKAIIHGRRRPVKRFTSVHATLIAMEYTPGSHRLPFAVEEVRLLHGLCESMDIEPVQPERHKQGILKSLPHCRIFHFAGHGYTDSTDPLKSHLLLSDGKYDPFTVENLLEMNLRDHSPFLAYLSACGTGRIGDDRLVDESIHLVSAFQLAGFRHAIGTLWEVNDEICVDMAKITYETMAGANMTDESVCRGLHLATRELRDRSLITSTNCENEQKVANNVPAHPGRSKTETCDMEGTNRLPRDIVPCDTNVDGDNDISATRRSLWVPYVHFGV